MRKFIKENYIILKNAIGKEPMDQIVMNVFRKFVGKAPKHRNFAGDHVISSKTSEDPYENYISTRNAEFKRRNPRESNTQTLGLIWILGDEDENFVDKTWSSILSQGISPDHIKVVSSNKNRVRELVGEDIFYPSLEKAISASTEQYLSIVYGHYILHPAFINEVLLNISNTPTADILYPCEDQVDKDGKRTAAVFKPQLNVYLLYNSNYIGDVIIVRSEFVKKIKGFDKKYTYSFMYDFLLRSIEQKAVIVRIDEVLVSKTNMKELPSEFDERKEALSAHLKRVGIDADVVNGIEAGTTRLQKALIEKPMVSIIIPFRDGVGLLKQCVESIFTQTDYEKYEILLVDNNSQQESTKSYLADVVDNHSNIEVLRINDAFNFSFLNNEAVKISKGEYILFLNNDTQAINKSWLSAMLEEAQRPDVGVVGAKLLYEDDTVQHAGVIVGVGHVAGHAFRNLEDSEEGYMSRANSTQEYLAVTGACLLTKRSLFDAVGGFDQENLKIAYNDVDYCLKIHDAGYKVIYTPYAKLYHYESKSRAYDLSEKEVGRYEKECDFMRAKWGDKYSLDPFFHPHLDNRFEDFRIA